MRKFIIAAVLVVGLGVGGVLIFRAHSGPSADDKAEDAHVSAALAYVKSDMAVVTERDKVAADKAIVVLDSDSLLGLSSATLVADTRRVLADLRLTPIDWTRNKMGPLLGTVDAAGCVQCARLVEAAM